MATNEQEINDIFKKAVREQIAQNPSGWSGEQTSAVIIQLLSNLTDQKGEKIKLTDHETSIIHLGSHPTKSLMLSVIKDMTAAHKCELDKTTKTLIKRIANPVTFRQELAEAKYVDSEQRGSAPNIAELLGDQS